MSVAVIIGSAGQDGKLLSKLLLSKGYRVIGFEREGVEGQPIEKDFCLITRLTQILVAENVSCLYYFAAYHNSSSDVLDTPLDLIQSSFKVNTLLFSQVLEAVRVHAASTKVFYAGSSHMYGDVPQAKLSESDPFRPKNVYAISKVAASEIAEYYRDHFSLFVTVGIMFNHESHYRDDRFLTKSIIKSAINLQKASGSEKIKIANPMAKVDWGYAPDYMEAVYEVMQLSSSGNFNIASGEAHSVEEFTRIVLECFNLDYELCVEISGSLNTEHPIYIGETKKIYECTGWRYTRSFESFVKQLVKDVVDNNDEKRST
ncbi:GDP-mannose 4,6-dehydratase [Dasania sp. GY-MA-18]|uniref:GDP-mannose 4,6-dehydratase n=1 Tax=Dasania phycosphaerae TaxID=2950436 RepID=A0A9J6RHW1_9GAMM|nr:MULTISPECIES: GDP-mannose 4,6-dehydratase [Dasania]MCR8921371.1 GDP-mannose 4,6-dehydratase [Dasania sp. GY-MA-18]MCZ0863799.1 GDP-mannose 4,6-dehydratase [Dasania phycosphaerae]MCZ0867527.1 GDP-mannose 4,6-dehydratase [Dasania phycosphaerae]